MAMAGWNRSVSMQTPTTTTRVRSGAFRTIWSMMPGTPTHSNTTGPDGSAPSRSATLIACHHGTFGR